MLLAYACKSDCEVDRKFEKRFLNSIDILETPYKLFQGPVKVSKFRKSMFFLIAVTGVEPTGFDIEYGIYNFQNDFNRDKVKWMDWYEKNKCEMTNFEADSLFIDYMDTFQGGRSFLSQ